MKPLDYILTVVVAAIIVLAAVFTVRNARHGKGCGGGCNGDCANCPLHGKKKDKSTAG